MNFGLTITITPEVEKKSEVIQSLSDDLKEYFKDRNYGNDIKSYIIGTYCLNVPIGFEKFSKLPKPSYTKGKKELKMHGINFTIEDSLSYDIKLDFETFKNASEKEAEKILAKEILLSLDTLDSIKKKIKDFDWEAFRKDLETYFKEKDLL